jgi:hypothetical protein
MVRPRSGSSPKSSFCSTDRADVLFGLLDQRVRRELFAPVLDGIGFGLGQPFLRVEALFPHGFDQEFVGQVQTLVDDAQEVARVVLVGSDRGGCFLFHGEDEAFRLGRAALPPAVAAIVDSGDMFGVSGGARLGSSAPAEPSEPPRIWRESPPGAF